eukprot:13640047-Alexandrium_andersonii.AAC.1
MSLGLFQTESCRSQEPAQLSEPSGSPKRVGVPSPAHAKFTRHSPRCGDALFSTKEFQLDV